MRRGNGDGSIFKLSGKRRKPYAVRVTVGWTPEGKQKYKYVGYYEKKTEAKLALNKYLADPTDTIVKKVTLKYVFNSMISSSKFSDNTIKQYKSGFNKLQLLHNKELSKITLAEIEKTFKSEKPSAQSTIKKALTNCYKYAIKHQYVKTNIAEYLEPDTINSDDKVKKTPFSPSEISHLWSTLGSQDNDDVTLIFIYTGMRTIELFNIETSNVNLAERWIDVKISKSPAGIRRLPIHDKIIPLIEARVNNGHKYLITTDRGYKMEYQNYYDRYWYSDTHTIHETRHTFATALNKAGVDELTVKRIIGHSDKDVTEHYTHRTQDELLEAVNKIYRDV